MIRYRKINLLVVGSLKPDVGGTTILFKLLLEGLRRDERFEVEVIDTSGLRGRGLRAIGKFSALCWKLMRKGWTADAISVQVMGTAVPFLMWPILLAKYATCKPVMLRLFGGWDFRGDSWLVRACCLWFCRRVDMLVVETQLMATALEKACGREVRVFFNNRRLPELAMLPRRSGPARKLIYLSHIRPEKGIGVLVDAMRTLRGEVELDVFGPFFGGLDETLFAGCENVHYRGVAGPEEVQRILAEHHVLVLPSYFEHEGHPGIILEAFSVGIPVISTRWRAIPEIVDETCGLLVAPHDTDGLAAAIRLLASDAELYARLASGAMARRDEFSDAKWNSVFKDYVFELSGRRNGR